MNMIPKRALLSVSDKTGLVPFARALVELGVELLSSGGTAAALAAAGLPVELVEDLTGFPEIMDGRVKTLHPRVHGGILGRSGIDDAVMAEHGIPKIDLVVVNFYPFEHEASIKNIDIGGPAMVRAAAKNHEHVAVLATPLRYDECLEAIDAGGITLEQRKAWAAEAFGLTARYDTAIHTFLSTESTPEAALPERMTLSLERLSVLRYGENPHQSAALYAPKGALEGLAAATLLQGKPLSYNNWVDADAALACIRSFDTPACAIIKHANPCGVAIAPTIEAAYQKAFDSDPQAAFGGIISFNRALDELTARRLIEQQFVEVIICPAVEPRALIHLETKPNLRVITVDMGMKQSAWMMRSIQGGLLVQTADRDDESLVMKVVTQRQPTDQEWIDLKFAWHIVKYVKSNAIVLAKDGQTLGIGAGQTARVASVEIAIAKAHTFESGKHAVLASDAFFPFSDSIEMAAKAGVRAIIQPGGSVRDAQVIASADEHGIAMVFTGVRHFYH
jgi:phosphoribosylaminoimidazolecarboxamide formyltransferase/IMP cyclohydrolase